MPEAKESERPQHETTGEPPGGEAAGPGLRGKVDQVGSLLSKGLDLAEAGLNLGVTLVSRVGVAAQHQILERVMAQAGEAAAAAAPQAAEAEPAPAPAPVAAAPAAESESYGISNRLPLVPGGEVRVSFSINNDSMEAPKKVALSVEGFVGDAHGRRLNPAGFAIRPAKKTIAPMDFEKFVLEGVLPPKAPPDVYRGWIVVNSDNALRIPVWLVVSSL